jgi:hypothetical protein
MGGAKDLDIGELRDRLGLIRERVTRAGGTDVKIVAVTKTWGAEALIAAHEIGCDGVGENYAQELLAKIVDVKAEQLLPVHFVGQLQTNKVRQMLDVVDVWESVDRASLVDELVKRYVGRPKPPMVLLQVNTTNEPDKGGCAPGEIGSLIERAAGGSLDVRGLMTVGPTSGDVAATSAAFKALAQWADRYGLHEKSMGMTGDYEIAVEMGATSLRLGTAIFGSRR